MRWEALERLLFRGKKKPPTTSQMRRQARMLMMAGDSPKARDTETVLLEKNLLVLSLGDLVKNV